VRFPGSCLSQSEAASHECSEDKLTMFKRVYSTGCIFFVNLVLVFAIANVIAAFFPTDDPFRAETHVHTKVQKLVTSLGAEGLRKLHPHRTEEEIIALLTNEASAIAVYEPFIQFRLPDYRSTTFNVSAPGFRHIGPDQGDWPINGDSFNIFVFGGSTTMGAGVSDQETLSRYLQDFLRQSGQSRFRNATVYNFGTGAYLSTQERIAFEQLVASGVVPDMAVFIDGVNELIQWTGEPAFTPFLRDASRILQRSWAYDGIGDQTLRLIKKMPLVALANRVLENTGDASPFPQVAVDESLLNNPQRFKETIERFLTNTRVTDAVARLFNVTTLFVLQPTAYYKYDKEKEVTDVLRRLPEGHHYALRTKYGYPMLEKRFHEESKKRDNFLSCASIFEASNEILYVDHVHYNPQGNKRVAECIGQRLVDKVL
jgi:hypothetical protein